MSSSTSASNKRPSTSTQQRDSPAGRRKRDGHSYSPSPSTEANRRVVAARRQQYASMMEVVNTENTSHVDHNAALAQHASSSAMVVDPTDAVAEALALNHRLLEREAAARRRLSESTSSARISSYQHLSHSQSTLIANSQKLAKQHETRAKAIAVTNPGASAWPVGIVAPRSSPGYSFKEAEYDQQISQYMVEMDVSTFPHPALSLRSYRWSTFTMLTSIRMRRWPMPSRWTLNPRSSGTCDHSSSTFSSRSTPSSVYDPKCSTSP